MSTKHNEGEKALDVEHTPNYPECDKWAAGINDARVIENFLQGMEEDGFVLMNSDGYVPSTISLLYKHFDIDRAKLEAERQAIVEAFARKRA